MNTKNTEQLFEVALKVDRHLLPPYYETFLNNLTYKQAIEVIKSLESCCEFCLFGYQDKKYNIKLLT